MSEALVRTDRLLLDDREIALGTPEWLSWLEGAERFRYEGAGGHFGARRERFQRGGWYWKAYRRVGGRLRRAYLGRAGDISPARLARVAAALSDDLEPSAEAAEPASLLATKLAPPPVRGGAVGRALALGRLERALRHPVCLIMAPAGWGKTTLLASWAAQARGAPVAWIALDADDDDPVRLWGYVCAALGAYEPAIQLAEAAIRTARGVDPARVVAGLINLLARRSGPPITLIVDDLHFLTHADILAALTLLVERLPAQLRLVLAGRSEPSLPLARWRAAGLVGELRVSDLRFDLDESQALLAQAAGVALSDADVQALLDSTEGWAAGLHMAGLALRSAGSASPQLIAQIRRGHPYIRDYLADEIVRRESPEVQTFLLSTAALDRMCGDLCDALLDQVAPHSQRMPSQAMLELLERRGLFVHALDGERRWFRYHGLFAEALRSMLARSQPDMLQRLQSAAAGWLMQWGGLDGLSDAIAHLIAIEDAERAAALLEQYVEELVWARGELGTLLRLAERLPRAVMLARPRLALGVGWALLASIQLGRSDALLREIDATHGAACAGEVAAIRSFILRISGDLSGSIELGDVALRLLPLGKQLIRHLVGINQENAYVMAGNLHAAARLASELNDQLRDYMRSNTAPPFLTAAGVELLEANILTNQARIREAEAIVRTTLAELERRPAASTLPTGMILASLAELRYEQGDLEQAERYARAALDQAERWWNTDLEVVALDQLGRALRARGDIAGAVRHFERLRDMVRSYRIAYITDRVELGLTWTALVQGDVGPAERALVEAGIHADGELDPAIFPDYLLLARVELARGRVGQAAILAERLRSIAERGGWTMRVIAADLLRARVAAAAGRRADALDALAQALALADPGGAVQIFIDEGEPIRELLAQIAGDQRHPLALAARRRLGAALPAGAAAGRGLPDALTEREQAILRRIAAGHSNQTIADDLVVSIHTVKKHITSLLAKLGAASRTAAVARGRELGLL